MSDLSSETGKQKIVANIATPIAGGSRLQQACALQDPAAQGHAVG
jgi:hypothetical protein